MKAARGRGCEVSDGHGGVSRAFPKEGFMTAASGHQGAPRSCSGFQKHRWGHGHHRTKLPEARPPQEMPPVWGDPDLSPSSGEQRT